MKKLIIIGILLILFPATHSYANEQELVEIQQIPKVGVELTPIESKIGEYDGIGRIDAIYPGRLVINDSNFYLSSPLKVVTMEGREGQLKKGIKVYYFLNKHKAIFKLVTASDN
ncbi:MAG: hypothetical protein GY710_05010 [Desulfobacteraceae bacterium]|nr:hypothetical protein [Desulfobacteraceae bacterium]